MRPPIRIALAGNPNSGKTSLFNALTGLNHKVSNFAGTTVEKKTGTFRIDENTPGFLIDLPGTYSLYPKSADEAVTYDLLRDAREVDVVLFIADASNLKRNLLLLTQVADLGLPVILALNMVDIAARRGIFYDLNLLSQQLSLPVVPINARNNTGVDQVKELLAEPGAWKTITCFDPTAIDPGLADELLKATGKSTAYAAVQFAINASIFSPKSTKTLKRSLPGTGLTATSSRRRRSWGGIRSLTALCGSRAAKKQTPISGTLHKR